MGKGKKGICGLLAMLRMTSVFTSCGAKETCDWRPNEIDADVISESLYVKKVENIPADFIFGMDASAVPSLEAGGVRYYDHDGVE